MSASKVPVMEIEVDYSHFQHLIQTSAAGFAPDVTPHPVTVTLTNAAGSPEVFPFTEVIDLSTSAGEQCPPPSGEKTPGTYGEVPGFLLDIARGCPSGPCAKTGVHSHSRSGSTVRVCLETRFKTMSADAPRFLSKHQQPQEAQEGVIQPQIQPWINTDRSNAFEVSSPYVPFVYNPVTNVCEQMFGQFPHTAEQKQQGPNAPKSSPFNVDSDAFGDKLPHLNAGGSSGEQQTAEDAVARSSTASRSHGYSSPQSIMETEATADCSGGSSSSSERRGRSRNMGYRKERHNLKERERRRWIRFYCDELNTLVPLCHAKSDKVTTLQWTTAYLRYIQKRHGDMFREEFKKAVSQGKELDPDLRSSSLHQHISAVEQ